jgi:CRP-like cAMP-binding protein
MTGLCFLPTFGPVGVPSEYHSLGFPEPQRFERDQVLTNQGQKTTKIYWIESGVVKKVRAQSDGSDTITGLRTAGWIIGATTLLIHSPQDSSAITATTCSLRVLPIDIFLKLYAERRELAMHVSQMLATELAVRLRANAGIRRWSVRARLEQFLEECDRSASTLPDGSPHLQLRQTEVAQIVGSTPEYLNRLLHQMDLEGALQKKSISIPLHTRTDGSRAGG